MSTVEGRAIELILRGNAFEDAGLFADALAAYDSAIETAPNLPRAYLNRGNALAGMGDTSAAIKAYDDAIARDPAYAGCYHDRGNTYLKIGDHQAAIGDYLRAIELRPEFVDAIVGLGTARQQCGDFLDAVSAYKRALQLNPAHVQVYATLGDALRALGRYDEAIAACSRAVELDATYVEGHYSLARAYYDTGQPDKAVDAMRCVIDRDPQDVKARSTLLYYASHDPRFTREALLEEHRRFGEAIEGPLRATWPRHANAKNPRRAIAVGFVSGDFRSHAMAYFIEPLLCHLTGSRSLELTAYSTAERQDGVSARLQPYFARWHDVASIPARSLAEHIARDGIDILVDLSGHTADHRLVTFAYKPAPIAVSWMGYLGTTGLRAIDYYICDGHLLPLDPFERSFTECLVHLPASAPFLPHGAAPDVGPLPAERNGYITFASFNRPGKIGARSIDLWARVLRELPGSRLVVAWSARVDDQAWILRMLDAQGVHRNRVRLYPHSKMETYLARHNEVDVCLDTFPYGGGTTTAHALWMGVPTLTMVGATPVGRHGVALLAPLGLDNFVACDEEDFVAKARAIASDVPSLAALRAGMRKRVEGARERRPEVVAAAVDVAFRTMWQRWCAGLPAKSFAVPLHALTV